MAIGLIGWGRFPDPANSTQRVTVPAPSTDPGKPWLWDFLRSQAAGLGASFDFLQAPPWSKAEGGAGPGCDGYGVFDRRDLGSKPQQGSTPTRYGSMESLLAMVAALNAHGCRTFGDLVLHQLIGENRGPGVFSYLGADGRTGGRGTTSPGWFRAGPGDRVPPFCKEDDVPNVAADAAFGRELSYQNCRPHGVTTTDAIDYLRWVTSRTGAAGYRCDDVKGTYAPAVAKILRGTDLPVYSEYFDGDPSVLNRWAVHAPLDRRSALVDFPLHWRIRSACNDFDATQLEQGGAGFWQWNAGLAVGFVDNPDTDTSPGQQVIFNKGLAYAYLLTLPLHMALVYGKDYFPSSVWPGAYGLRPILDTLCWISRTFAFGKYQVRWIDRDVHVASRDGDGGALGWSGGLLTALNFNTLSSRRISCATSFGANRWLHDYTGHHGDIWTDGKGNATFTIPSNANSAGMSFLCFAPGGVDRPHPVQSRSTTQAFHGDRTLDVMPLLNGSQVLPQRLFSAHGKLIYLHMRLHLSAHTTRARAQMELIAPSGGVLRQTSTGTTGVATLKVTATEAGWYIVRLFGSEIPRAGINFVLTATYVGSS